jgi:alpha-beta hydrolase superfamily lysophospholipase
MSRASNFTLTTPDGIDLFVYCWLPAEQPKAVIQIAHGLAEHAGRYARLAEALTSASYAVYANDHRGHGRTVKSAEDLGFFAERDGWRKCVNDMWQLNRHVAGTHPGLPIVLLGHSMGSTLAEQFMGDHGDAVAGVVLSGANGKPSFLAKIGGAVTWAERVRLGPRGKSKLVQSLTFDTFNKQFAPARTAFDWLSRDPTEVDKYVADPLCGFSATVQLWIDLLGGWAALSRAAHRNRVPKALPVYLIAGERDPVSGNTRQLEPWMAEYRAAGLVNLTHKFYPNARHELFNETNRDEVAGDLIGWLDQVVAKFARSAAAIDKENQGDTGHVQRILAAARFAAEKHARQKRKGENGEPYFNHLLEVAELIAASSPELDVELMMAAFLHDTVEDTGVTPQELEQRFGKDVADLVAEVTDDKSLPKETRKQLQVEHTPDKSPRAQTLKLADKISNLRAIISSPPVGWSRERKQQYFEWARQVVSGIASPNEFLQSEFNEAYRAISKLNE